MVASLVFFAVLAATTDSSVQLTTPINDLSEMFDVIRADIQRIEPFYPKQFERLEMDWQKNVEEYRQRFKQAKSVDERLFVLARFTNSWHNAHHRPLEVEGIIRSPQASEVQLPIDVFGQGLKLSDARFFVADVSSSAAVALNTGDEIIAYDGLPIAAYLLDVRDESRAESPEAIIGETAERMVLQSQCRWEKRRCWKNKQSVRVEVVDAKTKEKKSVDLMWSTDAWPGQTSAAVKKPKFPPNAKGWTLKILRGEYAISFDDENVGFLAALENGAEKYLLLKMFVFRDSELVQQTIELARDKKWRAVILDFQENHGGDDSAMTLMAGLLGTSWHLELSSLRLIPEFFDVKKLRDAAVYKTNVAFFQSLLNDPRNHNKMSPLVPFRCKTDACEPLTEYKNHIDDFLKPKAVPAAPYRLALITGRETVSKTDSIAALFRAHKIGPIIGTPAMASSGRYYFQKQYVARVGDRAIVLRKTFTPDFSIAANCEEVQANPPEPTVRLPRTFENREHYDTLAWLTAIESLKSWKEPVAMGRCSLEQARDLLRKFKLDVVEQKQ
jgi:Peptidase family S41/PDZ domain